MGKVITLPEILVRMVCANYDQVSYELLISRSRKKPLPEIRQICCVVLKENTKLTLQRIANILGLREHSTVLNSVNRTSDLMDVYPKYREKVNKIKAEAKRIAEEFNLFGMPLRQITLEPGDICWFWNKDSKFPILGTLLYKYDNDQKQQGWVAAENPFTVWAFCDYAGKEAFPTLFCDMLSNSVLNEKAKVVSK